MFFSSVSNIFTEARRVDHSEELALGVAQPRHGREVDLVLGLAGEHQAGEATASCLMPDVEAHIIF